MPSKDGIHTLEHLQAFVDGGEYRGWAMPAYPWAVGHVVRSTGIDPLSAGYAVAVFFACATVVPVFLLGLRMGGLRAALFSGLLWAVHPGLLRYDTDTLGMSAACFFIAACLAALMAALEGRSLAAIWLSPAFALSAVLSRREAVSALGAVFACAAMLWAASAARSRRHWFQPAFNLLLAAPVALLGALLTLNSLDGSFGKSVLGVGTYAALAVGGVEEEQDAAAQGSIGPATTRGMIRSASWWILPFSFWGGVRIARRGGGIPAFVLWTFAILAVLVPLANGLAHGAGWVSTRYFVPLAAGLTIVAGPGLDAAVEALRRFSTAASWAGVGILAAVCAVSGLFTAQGDTGGYREAGEYILKTYGPGQPIASTRNQVAYFARGHHVRLPLKDREPESGFARFVVMRLRGEADPDARILEELGKAVRLMELRGFSDEVRLYEAFPR